MSDGWFALIIWLVAGLLLLIGLGGCSSIDSVKEKKLDLCALVTDEHLRVDCIVHAAYRRVEEGK